MTTTTTDKPTRLLWMDVETTGLDTQHDRILEIGLIVTDDNLTPLDEGFHSIIRYSGETSEFITAMHTPNGLLAECAAPGAPTLPEAGEQARAYVSRWLESSRLLPAGSSLRFDRDIISHTWPHLLDGCSHRSFDVSVFYEAACLWSPTIAQNAPESTTDHRVMHCLADSLAYARYYKKALWGA